MSKFKYDLGIIGLGYVGLPLAVYSIDAGLKVFGYDINSEKVSILNQGISPIEDVSDKSLNSSIESGLILSDESNDIGFIIEETESSLTEQEPAGSDRPNRLLGPDIVLKLRDDARKNKNYELSDKIRDMLKNKGISINDSNKDSSFTID